MERVALQFGVPLASDKMEGPASEVKFLGIVLDSVAMECRLPLDKVQDLLLVVGQVRRAKKVRLRQVQSLLGKLNLTCRIIPMAEYFVVVWRVRGAPFFCGYRGMLKRIWQYGRNF